MSTRLIRKAQSDILEPQIASLGFTGKYPDFHRTWQDEVHFLHFYPRKYGGGFSFTGAWCKRGTLKHSGETFTEPDITIAHTEFDNRATVIRMAPVGLLDGTMVLRGAGDFDYEHIADDEEACRELIGEAAKYLPALDHWLKTRELAAGIDCKDHRVRPAASKQLLFHLARGMVGTFDLASRRPETPFLDGQDKASQAPEYILA